MLDPVTCQLARPIEHDGKTISSLTFREATLGDMILADSATGEMAKAAIALAAMAGVPYDVIKKIGARDANVIMKSVADLMGNDPLPPSPGAPSQG